MRAFVVLLLLAAPVAAFGDATGAALEACRAYAQRDLANGGQGAGRVVLDRDRDLALQLDAGRAGGQRLSAILTGNGAVAYPGTPGVELSFVCLLTKQERAVFFHWLARRDPSALAQCTRGETTSGAGVRPCLEALLALEERELAQRYAARLQQAHERDAAAGGTRAYEAYAASNIAWREYRDAECTRRSADAGAGRDPTEVLLACKVELSRLRAAEMGR